MQKITKNQILENQRAFYATIVCICTLLINIVYPMYYNTNPHPVVSLLPIILWIAYDGNENERAIVQGYWFWVLALIVTTLIILLYPLV